MTGKQLYEANHLYLMIAINTENVQEDYHLKTSLIAKTTSRINMQTKFQFSPLDGAHYANFSSSLDQNNQEKQCEIQQQYEYSPHAFSQKEKVRTNCIKTIIIFIFT